MPRRARSPGRPLSHAGVAQRPVHGPHSPLRSALQGSGQVLDPALLAGAIEGVTQPTRPDTGMGGDVHAAVGRGCPGAEETLPHGILPSLAPPPAALPSPGQPRWAPPPGHPKPKPKLGTFLSRTTAPRWVIPTTAAPTPMGHSRRDLRRDRWDGAHPVLCWWASSVTTSTRSTSTPGLWPTGERAADFETTLILDSEGTTLAEFSDYSQADSGARTEVPLNTISPG